MPHIPIHPSAEKRHRQSLKRAERNRTVKTRARSLAKSAAETIATSSDEAAAQEALKQATKVLYKAITAARCIATPFGAKSRACRRACIGSLRKLECLIR